MVKPRRRLFTLIDRSLQYKFLAIILIYSMIIVAFLAAFLFVPDILDVLNEDLSLESRDLAANRILYLHSRVWPTMIALICILGIHSTRVFHRVVGSLYRLRWAMTEVTKGNLGFRVELRKKDFLHREKETFNDMLGLLNEKLTGIRETALDALASVQSLEQGAPSSKELERERLQDQRKKLEALVEEVRFFSLKETTSEKFDPETSDTNGSQKAL